MWIFLADSFLSIVDKGGDGSTLLVRARRAGDIETIFPEASVVTGAGTDYRYRARLPRELVAARIAEKVFNTNCGNFKANVKDAKRRYTYSKVWEAMYDYQKNA